MAHSTDNTVHVRLTVALTSQMFILVAIASIPVVKLYFTINYLNCVVRKCDITCIVLFLRESMHCTV